MGRTWWRWGLVAAVAVAALALVVVALSGGDDDEPASTTTSRPGPLQEAVLRSGVEVDGVVDDDLAALIQGVCDAPDGTWLGEEVVALGVTDLEEVQAVVEGVGRGVTSLCPDVAAEEPQLLNDAYAEAVALLQDDDG